MKQKKNLLKLLTLVVCIMLILVTFNTYSKATITEDADTADITVEGVEQGVKVQAYQLTTVNYNYDADQPSSTPYEWVANVKTWLQSNHSEYLDIEKFTEEVKSEEAAKNFYSELAAAIKGGSIVLTPKEATVSGTATYPIPDEPTGSVTISDCEMGTYLIIIENGYKVYTPSVVNLTPEYNNTWELKNQKVVIKSTNPEITKTTNDSLKIDNYSTKDSIPFKIVADVPTYLSTSLSKTYSISDDLSNGLTLNKDSIKVYGQKGSAEKVLLSGETDYTLTTESATRPTTGREPVEFNIDFNYDSIKSFDKVIIEYTAKLSQTSSTVIGGQGNVNTAYLDYSNNPYVANSLQEQKSEDKIYTYGAEITKIDKTTSAALQGAEFELSLSGEKLYFVNTEAGVYYLANSTDSGATTTLAVNNEGKLYLYGLDTGTYSLKEIKAPGGYNLSNQPAEINITDENMDGALDDEEGTTGIYKLSFQNSKGFQLPTTGGIGTVLFTAGGILFVCLGIVILVAIRRKK